MVYCFLEIPEPGRKEVSGLKDKTIVRVMQLPSRGQITIPAEARRQLGLDEGDLIKLTVRDGKIEIERLVVDAAESLREYTDEELRQFMAEDQIDEETASRVKALLAEGRI